jgi:hypothetical protein
MIKSDSEAWIFLLIIMANFMHNMIHLMGGLLLQPTTLTISTSINHVHIAHILIIVPIIVHLGDNAPNFHMSK